MLGLQLPLKIENSLSPLRFRSQSPSISTPHNPKILLHPYTHLPSTKFHKIQTATTDVASQGENAPVATPEPLPDGLQQELMPKHIAVIMDGNVRWAKQRGKQSSAGHEAGVQSLRKLIEMCVRWGIKVLTVFAFSYDNWIRPRVEVDFLMSLFERGIKSELDNFKREGIQISVIGDSTKLPPNLRKLIAQAEEDTKNNTRLQLIVAVSYSGKYDIIQACRRIAEKVKQGHVQLDEINENLIEQELETNCTEFPYPDLLIRTSGELRVSNFLLWQLAYTELFFVTALWPDFGQEEFVAALTSFQERSRRYGGRA